MVNARALELVNHLVWFFFGVSARKKIVMDVSLVQRNNGPTN